MDAGAALVASHGDEIERHQAVEAELAARAELRHQDALTSGRP